MEQIRHCMYCGSRLRGLAASSRNCPNCGRTSYRNPTPVAVVVQPVGDGVLLIRRGAGRNTGELALPGGFIEINETWQMAAAREFSEETGLAIKPGDLELFEVLSGGVNLDRLMIFGLSKAIYSEEDLPPFRPGPETTGRLIASQPQKLAFNTHEQVLRKYFQKKGLT